MSSDFGVLGENRSLQEKSARSMHTTSYAMLPPLHGMGLGFAQHDINGHRVIVHDGDTRFFHSQLNLFLDDNVGLFLSLNSTGRDGAMDMVRSRSEEHTSELQSLMRISYAVFCLKKKNNKKT